MSLKGNTNEEKIWNYLKEKVKNDYGVAGIMGNMYAESGLRPNNLQQTYEKKLGFTDESYTKAVDDGSYTNFIKDSAGYGLVQWTYWSLKQDLYNYVKKSGKSIGDLEIQLEFLCYQLSNNYKTVWSACTNAKSVLEASNAMLLKFERPADQSDAVQKKRASYGQGYYDKYATKSTGTSGGQTTMSSKYDKYIYSTGTHYISNSGHDENRRYTGGKAGDQKGDEWALIGWYSRPWNVVLRHPNEAVRMKIAELGCAAALNNLVGYDQGERYTYWEHLKASNYDPSQITIACEDDCSAGVAANVKAVGYLLNIDALKNVSIYCYTGNLRSALVNAGFKALTESKYLTSGNYLLPGDILLYESGHTATNVTLGKSVRDSSTPSTSAPAASTENKTYCGKGIGTATAKDYMNIRSGSSTSYSSYGTIAPGTRVEVLEVLSNKWYKIVWPGASCGYAYTSNTTGTYYSYVANAKPATTTTTASGKVTASKSASSKSASLAGTYKTTADLNIRDGAGTSNKILVTIPEGTKVQNYGYYSTSNGTKWLYIQFTYKNIVYTGFASSTYLKKI